MFETKDIKSFHKDMQEKLLFYEDQGFKIEVNSDRRIKGMGYKVSPDNKTVLVHGIAGDWETYKSMNF